MTNTTSLKAVSVARNKGTILMPFEDYKALRREIRDRQTFQRTQRGFARLGYALEYCLGTEHRQGGIYKLSKTSLYIKANGKALRTIVDKAASLVYFVILLSEKIKARA